MPIKFASSRIATDYNSSNAAKGSRKSPSAVVSPAGRLNTSGVVKIGSDKASRLNITKSGKSHNACNVNLEHATELHYGVDPVFITGGRFWVGPSGALNPVGSLRVLAKSLPDGRFEIIAAGYTKAGKYPTERNLEQALAALKSLGHASFAIIIDRAAKGESL